MSENDSSGTHPIMSSPESNTNIEPETRILTLKEDEQIKN